MNPYHIFEQGSVLITGGTGSVGRRLVELILDRSKVRRLIVFSRDEYKQQEMSWCINDPRISFVIGDVRDASRLEYAMRGIDFVIHTAALKQIPIAELNPMECVSTNIIGSSNVIEAALKNRVKKAIAISSDKATNPINLYGGTKLVVEKLFTQSNSPNSVETGFAAVRYGNVLGSRGSIVEYIRRLAKNGASEIPVTDIEMTRFWITLDQAAEFICKCICRMVGGEIFIPKVPSMRIVDLAKCLAPNLRQTVVGVRAGEKVHELLCSRDCARGTFEYPDHYVVIANHRLESDKGYRNAFKEVGTGVPSDFEYSSKTNNQWLSARDLEKLFPDIC